MNKPVMPEEESQDKYSVPGLERGLRLLCEFSRQDKTLSAPELARRLDIPRSTVFRLLATLERMGFVERADGGRDYRLGMSVLRLGFEYLASLELTEIGRPLLDRLRDETVLRRARIHPFAVLLALRTGSVVRDAVPARAARRVVPTRG
jgi:DNA-binding MarR family transcriptional regulator